VWRTVSIREKNQDISARLEVLDGTIPKSLGNYNSRL
jgi:hypothetical protein